MELKCGTFQVADLRFTVLPLLVTVHFILMKKSRSVDISLLFFPKPGPTMRKKDNKPCEEVRLVFCGEHLASCVLSTKEL